MEISEAEFEKLVEDGKIVPVDYFGGELNWYEKLLIDLECLFFTILWNLKNHGKNK